MDQLKELAKELGQPGAEKLWQEAQRRSLPVTRKEVQAYVRTLGSRQVFQARPKYEGKIAATEINDRWVADLIDYNARPSQDPKDKNEPFQYILIVQDIFSRVVFTKALKRKDQETVSEAFKEIVRNAGVPDRLDTDAGNEFKGAFEDFLREKRIYHSVSDIRNKNARGTPADFGRSSGLGGAAPGRHSSLQPHRTREPHRQGACRGLRGFRPYLQSEGAGCERYPEEHEDRREARRSTAAYGGLPRRACAEEQVRESLSASLRRHRASSDVRQRRHRNRRNWSGVPYATRPSCST
jgi:Integrase core domain